MNTELALRVERAVSRRAFIGTFARIGVALATITTTSVAGLAATATAHHCPGGCGIDGQGPCAHPTDYQATAYSCVWIERCNCSIEQVCCLVTCVNPSGCPCGTTVGYYVSFDHWSDTTYCFEWSCC